MIAKAKCKPVAWVGNWVKLKPTDFLQHTQKQTFKNWCKKNRIHILTLTVACRFVVYTRTQ